MGTRPSRHWLAGIYPSPSLSGKSGSSGPDNATSSATGGRVITVTINIVKALAPWFIKKKRNKYVDRSASQADVSLRLRKAVETLGPTYIKLGQIISSGEGLFPPELVDQFKKCRDQVPAEPFSTVRQTVEQDLGARLEDVFEWFDEKELAAASIAQVHAARLLTGEDVVVKVQRPRVASLVRKDLTVMAWIAPYLVGRIPISALANPPALVELLPKPLLKNSTFVWKRPTCLTSRQCCMTWDKRATSFHDPTPLL